MRSSAHVITIDGPAGAGKSTAARMLAGRLGYFLLDSGALYRVVALHLMQSGISGECDHVPAEALDRLDVQLEPGIGSMRLFLRDREVTKEIRTERIGDLASRFSAKPEVRKALIGVQRAAAAKWDLVAEGRDMGTVVFPDASIKFFLTATLEVRARRRYDELRNRGDNTDFGTVLNDMVERDARDERRAEAPLKPADDSIIIDTSSLDAESVVEMLIGHVKKRRDGRHGGLSTGPGDGKIKGGEETFACHKSEN
ncbi:MAG: (d)CMP kinase [Thermodesulfobacteriota bacterium]